MVVTRGQTADAVRRALATPGAPAGNNPEEIGAYLRGQLEALNGGPVAVGTTRLGNQ